jgi:AraC-like DNA-binding protein
MSSILYFTSLLCSFGVLQSIPLAIALLYAKNERVLANRLLAMVVLLISLRVTKPLLVLFAELPFALENLGITAMLLAVPLFFLHLQVVLEGRQQLSALDCLHSLPFVLYLLISWNFQVFRSEWYSLVMVHNLAYLGGGIYLVWSHHQAHSRLVYNWALLVTGGMVVIWASFVYAWVFHPPITAMLYTVTLGYTMLVCGLLYLFLTKKLIFAPVQAPKYRRSRIDVRSSKQLFEELYQLVTSEKLFLESSLSLQQVSYRMGIPAREVSQLVNENTATNFSNWVNEFRVQEARQRLTSEQYQDYKIAAIAFDCGFNTLSSFNSIFKAKTGQTPSEYRTFHRINLN